MGSVSFVEKRGAQMMGYNIHITRADVWTESKRYPISEEEWLAVVYADTSLRLSSEGTYHMREDDGRLTPVHAVEWIASTEKRKPCFWLKDGQIEAKSPNRATIQKMVDLAVALNAKVLGDENELYAGRIDSSDRKRETSDASRNLWWKWFRR